MGKTLKNLKTNSVKTYTLSFEDKRTLVGINSTAQKYLDAMQNEIASIYLQRIAVEKFGYAENCDLRFSVDFEKPEDNFVVTNISK